MSGDVIISSSLQTAHQKQSIFFNYLLAICTLPVEWCLFVLFVHLLFGLFAFLVFFFKFSV